MAYVMIGSDGKGGPICIDHENVGGVVQLDHDAGFAATLINTDAARLTECLLAFRDLVRDAQDRNGDHAYLDGDIPLALIERLNLYIRSADALAMQADSCWAQQIAEPSPGSSVRIRCGRSRGRRGVARSMTFAELRTVT